MHSDVIDEQGPAKSRRQLKNFFGSSRYQLRYINWTVSGAFVIMVTTVGLIHYRLKQVDGLLNSAGVVDAANPGLGSHVPIYDAFVDITSLALGGFVLFVLFACWVALIMNKRVAGPTVALVAYIEQMRNGNYDYERALRKNDELKPIHEALQDLNSALKRRYDGA